VKWKVTVSPDSKFDGLLKLLTSFQGEQTIVFCNFREATEKIVEYLDEHEYPGVNIPTGIPLLYEFDDQFEPIKKGGEYLDPDAAKAAIEAVANQGKK
jgi:2,3-bisphosphoglycerate-dependent phosphoglycerate mutase